VPTAQAALPLKAPSRRVRGQTFIMRKNYFEGCAMNRRNFIKTTTMLPAVAAVSAMPQFVSEALAAATDKWRVFEVTTKVGVLKPTGVSRVWLPLPLAADTDFQKNLGSTWSVEGGTATVVNDGKYGAEMLYFEAADSGKVPAVQVTSRFATRDRAVDLSKPGHAVKADRAELQRYLAPTELIPTDGIVRDTAREITKNAGSGDIEKARAIYEWIVENTYRDPKTRGCGVGDIKYLLESKNLGGKCADLNALFVGLARSIGIPARDVYGVRVAKSAFGYRSLGVGTDIITRAQHCRAEFYTAAYGWIPVDPADVRKVVLEERADGQLLPLDDQQVKAARAKLFGAWEMNWLALNTAHDVALPKSSYGKIGFLMYPQAETAAGRFDSLDPDNFRYVMTAQELTSF
jgi:transglutaminase-like putative cysteine protease